jgi:hypothetical protein
VNKCLPLKGGRKPGFVGLNSYAAMKAGILLEQRYNLNIKTQKHNQTYYDKYYHANGKVSLQISVL